MSFWRTATYTFAGPAASLVLAVACGSSQGSLDSLNLTKGQEYALELFNAERHTDKSDFRADTNLAFTNCGTVPVQ